jgi:biopolymer transport protein ExbB
MWDIFLSTFETGGWVLWPIFCVSVLSWYIGLGKLAYLWKLDRARKKFFSAMVLDVSGPDRKTGFPPYDFLLERLRPALHKNGKYAENAIKEFLAEVVPDFEHGLSTIAACVSIAPLLGLLGTISGMNRMFGVITEFGLGNPGFMAGGISLALQSALTGLAVAVASMFLHNYLSNRKNATRALLMKDGETLMKITAREAPGRDIGLPKILADAKDCHV